MSESFEQWAQDKRLLINIREEMMYTSGYINVKEMAREAWQAALQHGDNASRETLASWMLQHGFATGHGDTLDDLLTELGGQIQKHSGEPVYAYRRKGVNDFCTCDASRYLELKAKPNFFEVAVFYTTPQPVVPEDTLRAAFIAGFRYCAVKWAGRDDLYSDVHSEKFCNEMEKILKAKALLSAGKGGE